MRICKEISYVLLLPLPRGRDHARLEQDIIRKQFNEDYLAEHTDKQIPTKSLKTTSD